MDDTKLNIIEPTVYENCEWCFQFDNDEPYVFASTNSIRDLTQEPKITFTLNNNSESNFIFSYNGKTFKLFARELSDVDTKIIKTI